MRAVCIATFVMAVSCNLVLGQHVANSSRYVELSDRIYFHDAPAQRAGKFRLPPEEQMNQITIELHNMVTRAIQEALSASKPSSDSVRKMMTDLQGPCSLNAFLDSKNVPYADLSYTNGMPSLLAAFAVLRGGSGIPQVRAYLQFYAQVGGVWELRTETGSEFDDTAFSVARIRSGASNESWYLVWGGVIGDTGARRKVRLYGFDGYAVRTIWQRDDLRGANISVSGAADKVTIEHNSYPPEGVLAPPRRIVDVMRATVNGLILESSRVVPDPAPIERK